MGASLLALAKSIYYKLMYSPNFYDFDSEQFHKVMLQEKLSGSYVT